MSMRVAGACASTGPVHHEPFFIIDESKQSMSQPNISASSSASNLSSSFAVNSGADPSFIERRSAGAEPDSRSERRQFGSSHTGLSEDGRELAFAIDQFKALRHRRYLTCDEMLIVIRELGYDKRSD